MTGDGLRGKQILIVDDTPANIDVLDQFLEQEGYRISVASSGEAAIELIHKTLPDLILLDVMMPGIDGFETCRRLKKIEPAAEIPVIFITAKNETADIVKGFTLGGVDYITKPFRQEEVLARIRIHLELKHLIEELEKQNKKLVELNDLKNKFLGMASHDLRNPLASIHGFSKMLIDHGHALPAETRDEFLHSIHKVSNEMLHLLGDLLNISAIESGKLDLKPTPGSIKDLVEEKVRMYKTMAERKDIRTHSEIEDVKAFSFDPHRIGQVLDNLLSNAIKYSPPGKEIFILLEQQGDRVRFSVRDEGPGISMQDQDKLFQHFVTLDTKPTGDEPSHGLGLAIARKMIEAHHGKIEVESAPGKGSTFRFEIPMNADGAG